MKKLIINENEKNNIINLYRKHDILLSEAKGGRIGRKLSRLLSSKNLENLIGGIDSLFSGERNYYTYSITPNGGLKLESTLVDKDTFIDDLNEIIDEMTSQNGRVRLSSENTRNFFTQLFMVNDAKFAMDFIQDRINQLDVTDVQLDRKLDSLSDLVLNALGNDIFKSDFPVEVTYFQKLYDLLSSQKFVDAGPKEKIKLINNIATKPRVLSSADISRLESKLLENTRALIELFKGLSKSSKQIKSEIKDLISSYIANDFKNGDSYAKEILLKLNELETRGNDTGKKFLQIIKLELEQGTPEEKLLLDSLNEMNDYEMFSQLRDVSPPNILNSIQSALQDMLDTIPLGYKNKTRMVGGKETSKRTFGLLLNNKKFWIKFATFMFSGQFITPREIYRTIIKSSGSSGSKTVTKSMVNLYVRSVAGQLMFPAFNFVFWGIVEPIADGIEDAVNNNDNFFANILKDYFGDGGKIDWTDFDRDELLERGTVMEQTFWKQVEERFGEDNAASVDWIDLIPRVEPAWPLVIDFLWGTNSKSTEPVNVIPDAPVVDEETYRDNIVDFKKWLEDNNIEYKSLPTPKRLDDGSYKIKKKNESIETFYIYENGTFKQD